MKHFIIYKQKGEYASFPLIEKKDDRYYVSFFVAPKIDHLGRYDYKIYSTNDFKIWENENFCLPYPCYINNRDYNDKIKTENIIISIPGFKKQKFKQSILIRENNEYDEKTIEKGLVGLKSLFAFPRGIIKNEYIFLPAYGSLNNRIYFPFLIRYHIHTEECKIIQMFSNPFVNLNEYALIEIPTGLMALFRQGNCVFMAKSFSYDNGDTWTYPENTHIYGYPPHLLRLSENKILCTYGYRQNPMGIRAVLINNECEKISKEIILRDDGDYYSEFDKLWNRKKYKQLHIGYPISMKLNESEIITVYYITGKDHITHIAGTIWRIEEFVK